MQCSNFYLPKSKLQVDRYRMCLLTQDCCKEIYLVGLRFAHGKFDRYSLKPVYRRPVQRDYTVQLASDADEARFLRECQRAKREKHVLNGATMIPLVTTTFGKLGPSAESCLQSLSDVACFTGFVDCGVWLRVVKQFLSCALVRGLGIVFRHYYKSIAKCFGKDFRDGAVLPFE